MKLTAEMCLEVFSALDIDTQRWISAIVMELDSAKEKHPNWPDDFIHKAAIVAEETGELVQAALQHQYEKGQYYKMHKEAVQVGATILRFLQNAPELPLKK